jgi:hypothetical protein
MADQIISQEYLKSIFDYKDGNLIWKNKTFDSIGRSKSHLNGQIAGTLDNRGYFRVKIDNKNYLIHRLIFMWHYGFFPIQVDHIDGNPLNNSIENLRKATNAENCRNSKLSVNNKSGVKGVSWHKASKKWMAHLQTTEKRHFIGYFDEIEKAKIAIIDARNKFHGEFARHR